MKRYGFAAAAIIVGLAGCAQMRSMTGMDWETLLDGDKGLENFDRVGDANWRAEGGAIVADRGKGGHLVSNKTYGDFEIRAEFWAETDTNSGIFIRCNDRTKITAVNCYEVNIWDIRPQGRRALEHLRDHGEGLAVHGALERHADGQRPGWQVR